MAARENPPGHGAQAESVLVPLTPLVGREREAAKVVALLRRAEVRLLTLTGPGGVGKTRLALHAAEAIRAEYRDGARFVALAPSTDPALLVPTIARALAIQEPRDRPLVEAVREALAGLQVLLVLDNFEQIAGAASQVADLLGAGPKIKALVTSRARLGLAAEHVYPVPSLDLPPPDRSPTPEKIARTGATALFVERARASDPTFALDAGNAVDVAAVCRALDGLPLAIELAAARVRVLPPRLLRARLGLALLTGGTGDRPERQRTMRDTIAWSHELLDPDERALFRRLAVFVGGWTLSTAERVCDLDDGHIPVLDGLQSLVDKSLVQRVAVNGPEPSTEPRFAMLETIREFALAELRASGEEPELRRRHAEAFADLASDAFVRTFRADRGPWLERLGAELDNFRAALGFAVECGDAELAQRIAGRFWRYWQARGMVPEGVSWLERALALDAESTPSARLDVLIGLHQMAEMAGQADRALRLAEEALDLARVAGDRLRAAVALGGIGKSEMALGHPDRAARRYDEALRVMLEIGDKSKAAYASGWMAMGALLQGDHDRFEDLARQELALNREVGDQNGVANALVKLAEAARLRGDFAGAAGHAIEALAIRQAEQDWPGIGNALLVLARVAGSTGRPDLAVRWFGAEAALRAALGFALEYEYRALHERAVETARAALGVEAFDAALAAGRALTIEEAVAEALAFVPDAAGPGVAPAAVEAGPRLTPQERRVLCLIAEGKTDRQIAELLFVQRSTARRHVANLYEKLGIHNRAEATRLALERGMCESSPAPSAT